MPHHMTTAPQPVAFARICIGIAAVLIALEGHAFLLRIHDGRLAVPVLTWWPRVADLPLGIMLMVGALAGVGLAVGSCTRSCAGLVAGLQAVTLVSDQQLYSSHRVLLMVLCCHLMFARSDAVWSLRSRFRGTRPSIPLWPQLLMIGVVSSLYLFAGLSKINETFLSGEVLRDHLVLQLSDSAYELLSWATVPTEVFIAVSIWFGRTRRLAIVMGIALHLSIIALLGDPLVLTAFALLCFGIYPMVWRLPVGVRALRVSPDRAPSRP